MVINMKKIPLLLLQRVTVDHEVVKYCKVISLQAEIRTPLMSLAWNVNGIKMSERVQLSISKM